jgi:uncharacterized membrane protein
LTASGAAGKPSGELAIPGGRISIEAGPTPRGRDLRFPEEEASGWGEFLRHASVAGCACATADVNAISKPMRRACLAHGVVAFFFNTIILAQTIAIGAGLI